MRDLITRLYGIGILVVAAAGNDEKQEKVWPCAYAIVVCVGSIGPGFTTIDSNYGDWVDIVAPGENIFSSVPGPKAYDTFSGTSAATPHVAGVVATILSEKGLEWTGKDKSTNASTILLANAQIQDIRNFGPSYVANNGVNNADKGADDPFFIPKADYPLHFPPKLPAGAPPPSQDKPLAMNLFKSPKVGKEGYTEADLPPESDTDSDTD